eukprot:GHVP01021735.1.p1 GENE.GHVP01021735.1~~GHVP01021735.1.p1  ORF type:complete len:260 (-),score=19.73 GHVP01021735.1:81-860(-)
MSIFKTVFLIAITIVYDILFTHLNTKIDKIDHQEVHDKSALFVIAHPDDECMFFTPTIVALLEKNLRNNVHIVCLCLGYIEKERRIEEFIKSALVLGIPSENTFMVHNPQLPDGRFNSWPASVVSGEIEGIEKKIGRIDIIFTFDDLGVSGHQNHIDTSNGSLYYGKRHNVDVKRLKTWRYSKKFGFLMKFLTRDCYDEEEWGCTLYEYMRIHEYTFIISRDKGIKAAWDSLKLHETQDRWFRRYFVEYTLYSYVNQYI